MRSRCSWFEGSVGEYWMGGSRCGKQTKQADVSAGEDWQNKLLEVTKNVKPITGRCLSRW